MKKLIIKIALAIVIIGLAIGAIVLFNHINKAKKPKYDTEVNIIVYNIEEEIVSNKKFNGKDKTLFDLLNDNYEIRYEESIYGVKLLDIDEIKTNFIDTFIAIYVDGVFSTRGISYITLHDKILIELKESKALS